MSRNLSLDLLKFVMAFMVVGIHCDLLHEHSRFWSTLFTSYVFRIAVPIFFMINGYFSVGALSSLKRFSGWFWRVLSLYIVWMAIYFPAYYKFLNSPWNTGQLLFLGHFHLWYLIATALSGLLAYGLKFLDQRIGWALIILTYGTGLFLQYAGSYHLFRGSVFDSQIQPFYIYRNVATVGFAFFALGRMVALRNWVETAPKYFEWELFGIGVILMATEYLINTSNHIHKGFDLLFCLPVLALSVFLIALRSKATIKTTFFHQASAAIYLIHPWGLRGLEKLGLKDSVLAWAAVIVICVMVTPALSWIGRYSEKYLKISVI